MRLPRFRLRTLMIAVAVAGVAMYGARLRSRSHIYAERAECFEFFEDLYGCGNFWAEMNPEQRRSALRMAEITRAMGRKYRRAARYPWLPVAPDPPPPK